MSRVTDNSDWELAPRKFKHFNKMWGPHTIDRLASYANRQLPRYNAKRRDGTTDAVDNLRLPDIEWRRERNWCSPPWELRRLLASAARSWSGGTGTARGRCQLPPHLLVVGAGNSLRP